MRRYIIQRLLWLIVILVCSAMIIFTIMYCIPGDPAKIALGTDATAEELDAFREMYGLNDTYMQQLATFIKNVFLHLDFGTSYTYKQPVMDEFISRVPRTLTLSMICLVISAGIGIPLGVAAAMHQNGIIDRLTITFSTVGVCIPNFWLALLMVILFTQKLGWLPGYGIDSWKCWIMPVIAGSVASIATNARQTRSAVLETIRADFVTTAKAKGVPEQSVIWKHMLPNALIPVVNGLGNQFARAIAGTVVIESVFSFPGVGLYMLSGINNRDYPVVRACVLVLAMFSAIAVLLTDIVYAFLDPRIKAQYANTAAKKRR